METIIIYHGDCPDGFTAAWLWARTFRHTIALPYKYGQPLPEDRVIAGERVVVLDFSFPQADMEHLLEVAGQLIWFDHHYTAMKWAIGDERFGPVNSALAAKRSIGADTPTAWLDEGCSGAGLVARLCLQHGVNLPPFVWNVEDRDLWKFDLDDTHTIHAALSAREYTWAAWDAFAALPLETQLVEGRAVSQFRLRLIEHTAALSREVEIDGHLVLAAPAPIHIGSDVAGLLATLDPERPFAAYYQDQRNGRKWGLRRRGDSDFNVAEVAARMEPGVGGGHAAASGYLEPWG